MVSPALHDRVPLPALPVSLLRPRGRPSSRMNAPNTIPPRGRVFPRALALPGKRAPQASTVSVRRPSVPESSRVFSDRPGQDGSPAAKLCPSPVVLPFVCVTTRYTVGIPTHLVTARLPVLAASLLETESGSVFVPCSPRGPRTVSVTWWQLETPLWAG